MGIAIDYYDAALLLNLDLQTAQQLKIPSCFFQLRKAIVLREESNKPYLTPSSGLPVDVEDVLNVLSRDNDTLKHQRCLELLNNWSQFAEMLKAFDIEETIDRSEVAPKTRTDNSKLG